MTQKVGTFCLLISTLTLATRLAAAVPIQRSAQVAHTDRIKFAPGGTIRFDNSFGDLYIEGWDRPSVEMTLIKEMRNYAQPNNVTERLERVQFTTEHPSADQLKISTTIPSRRFFRHPLGDHCEVTVRYEFRVPRDSHLVIQHGGGNILISNVTGGIEARNRNGDIVLMLPGPGPYFIDAKSKVGTVTSDFEGKTHVRHFVGEGFTGSNRGAHPIHLRVGIGGITIKEMPPETQP